MPLSLSLETDLCSMDLSSMIKVRQRHDMRCSLLNADTITLSDLSRVYQSESAKMVMCV